MYVFKYVKKSDNSVLGFHQSTYCQLSETPVNAKKYNCENPEEQLKTIQNNFKHVVTRTEENKGFLGLAFRVKEEHFQNLSYEDVEIIPEKFVELE